MDAACLRPKIARLFAKAYNRAGRQILERIAEQTVAVKIYQPPTFCLNASKALFLVDFRKLARVPARCAASLPGDADAHRLAACAVRLETRRVRRRKGPHERGSRDRWRSPFPAS